ncbi:hypothetical protein DDE82_004622 [Stemphylium lycopersici]|uniref:P-loop containing nucleoside triphosphate hydrolase protein n=1 Tax=Stemphylium lycopersici TaxID=183478 RepID=A0A364N3Y2_STELY|nr:hypothetical protein TW65_02922 [Stemphylium lycopersici]RAR04417.1 hypothetical protein DDE82_004622 [Stemphylium lycopersici]RAR10748.1 hypothetical protein DDE83_004892 [Stemphylium lycopersici]
MPGAIDTPHTNGDAPARRGVYHLTYPRSASNLFQNMMSKQPGFQNSGYKLFDAGFATMTQLERGPLSQWPEADCKALYESFETAWGKMQDEMDDAQKNGKQVFIKEHVPFLSAPDRFFRALHPTDKLDALFVHERGTTPDKVHTNPTSLPDTFLLKFQPIFQIRHPVLMFPSLIRAQKDVKCLSDVLGPFSKIMLHLRHTRELYDWYVAHGATVNVTPRIIDADDIMNSPETVRLLCKQTGLDPDSVAYEWESREVKDPLQARFLSTIAASKGIIPGLAAKGKSVETEQGKWIEEFGEKEGRLLAKFVESAMPDYEYLYARRTVAVDGVEP